MPAIHGGGCPSLDFAAVASRSQPNTVEPKVCESCTRPFFRAAVVPMQYRQKFCPACRARTKKQPAGVQ